MVIKKTTKKVMCVQVYLDKCGQGLSSSAVWDPCVVLLERLSVVKPIGPMTARTYPGSVALHVSD